MIVYKIIMNCNLQLHSIVLVFCICICQTVYPHCSTIYGLQVRRWWRSYCTPRFTRVSRSSRRSSSWSIHLYRVSDPLTPHHYALIIWFNSCYCIFKIRLTFILRSGQYEYTWSIIIMYPLCVYFSKIKFSGNINFRPHLSYLYNKRLNWICTANLSQPISSLAPYKINLER